MFIAKSWVQTNTAIKRMLFWGVTSCNDLYQRLIKKNNYYKNPDRIKEGIILGVAPALLHYVCVLCTFTVVRNRTPNERIQ